LGNEAAGEGAATGGSVVVGAGALAGVSVAALSFIAFSAVAGSLGGTVEGYCFQTAAPIIISRVTASPANSGSFLIIGEDIKMFFIININGLYKHKCCCLFCGDRYLHARPGAKLLRFF
jgi:hypothetical protein